MAETSGTSAGSAQASGDLQARGGSQLVTARGKTSIADSVVAKIAGISAREVSGVHNMGTGAVRAVGAIRERIPGAGGGASSPAQGVKVEVGERQAAVDVDLVVDYGVSIVDVAEAVRQNVISRIEGMTGLEVTEVNVSVDDIWMGEEESGEEEEPRVQ
jgi:uncharacterized alkaline shock family protein YloU